MHNKNLTSLRGLACMTVVVTHILQLFNLPLLLARNHHGPGSVQRTFVDFITNTFNGQASVEVFFVLSGCVLSVSLMKRATSFEMGWIKPFYIKRVFRIYPALWVSILLVVCLWPIINSGLGDPAYGPWLTISLPRGMTPLLVGLSLVPAYIHLNAPVWSLRVELLYSVLFPAIYLLVRNSRTRLPFLALLLLGAIAPFPRELSLHYALAFGLGASIPFSRGIMNFRYRLAGSVAFVALMYAALLFANPDADIKQVETVDMLISFVVVYCIHHNRRPLFLENGIFVFLGNISYSVYVLHFPILCAVGACIVKVFGVPAVHAQPMLFSLFAGSIAMVIVIPVCALSKRYVEDAGGHIGRRLIEGRRHQGMSSA